MRSTIRRTVFLDAPRVLVTLFALALQVQAAYSQGREDAVSVGRNRDAGLVLKLGAGHSDNIDRVGQQGRSASYSALGAAFDIGRDSNRISARLNGDLERRNYSVSVLEDETYGTLDGTVSMWAIPDRLSWLFADNYGQIRSDPFRIDSPTNREYVNVASSGPRLVLPLGQRTLLNLSGRLAKRSYEKSSLFDGRTTEVQLEIGRAISSRSQVGVSMSGQRTRYYASSDWRNDINDIYLSYRSELASGSASVALGRSSVEFGQVSDSTPYASLEWEKAVGARSRVVLTASTRFTDAGQSFMQAGGQDFTLDRLDDILASADVYKFSEAGFAYSVDYSRMHVELVGRLERNRYENDVALDSRQRQLSARVGRTISPRLDFGFALFAAHRTFDALGRVDDDRRTQLWLTKRFADGLALSFQFERGQRESSNAADFVENVGRLLVEYELDR